MVLLKKYLILTFLCLITYTGFSKEKALRDSSSNANIVYKERVNDEYTRFYFDDNYYLVDKNCPFKAIERVAKYDSVNFKFNGDFKDFDYRGKILLEGTFKNGVKEGTFVAYHPNGTKKWEANYHNNEPLGERKYYYPDGKPMLNLTFTLSDVSIDDYWDTYGIQKVKNGQGKYEMKLPILGFSEHGYSWYIKSGDIKDGKLHGSWYTSFVVNEKRNTKETVYIEDFNMGIRESFVSNDAFSDFYIPLEDFYIVPPDLFSRAELFLVKGCSFDEYSGFNYLLIRKFSNYLENESFNQTNQELTFEAQYAVSKTGTPGAKKIINQPNDLEKQDRDKILNMFDEVYYFIPSILDNQEIKDNISIIINIKIINQKAFIQNLTLKREIGK